MREQDLFKRLRLDEELLRPPAWHKNVQPDGRVVWAPNKPIREEHDWLLHQLSMLDVEIPFATGGVKYRNIFTNVQRHRANRHFFQLDLADAYEQVHLPALAAKLSQLGLPETPEENHSRLQESFMPPEGGGLAQGGPASPMLFNIYCLDMDAQLGIFCQEQGITYSRYLDDLTFSSPDTGFPTGDVIGKDKRRAIREIIGKHQLAIKETKTRVSDLARGPIRITGLQLNPGGKIQPATRDLRVARAQLLEIAHSSADVKDVLEYAAGLKGWLSANIDRHRRMSDEEKALFIEAQGIIDMYGRGISRF